MCLFFTRYLLCVSVDQKVTAQGAAAAYAQY
jgi:hypothetical protein